MDPLDKLREARSAASEGRHADALAGLRWFHDHALSHDPATYGVRLSFALGDWVELGRSYPEALRALEAIRDAKDEALVAGSKNRSLFHDVAAINERLKATDRTCVLIRRLFEVDAAFARSCGAIALPALVDARDYGLAADLLVDPRERVRELCRELNEGVSSLQGPVDDPRQLERKRAAHAGACAGEVAAILAVLNGVGRTADAAALYEYALSCVEDGSVREALRDLLSRDGEVG